MVNYARRPPRKVVGPRTADALRIEALARTCPLCQSGPREWCVRVIRHGTVSKERGEILYPVRVKNLHKERLVLDGEQEDGDAGTSQDR